MRMPYNSLTTRAYQLEACVQKYLFTIHVKDSASFHHSVHLTVKFVIFAVLKQTFFRVKIFLLRFWILRDRLSAFWIAKYNLNASELSVVATICFLTQNRWSEHHSVSHVSTQLNCTNNLYKDLKLVVLNSLMVSILQGLESWEKSVTPFTESFILPASGQAYANGQVLDCLRSCDRGLIVIGQQTDPNEAIASLKIAEALSWPAIVDVLSGEYLNFLSYIYIWIWLCSALVIVLTWFSVSGLCDNVGNKGGLASVTICKDDVKHLKRAAFQH